jgi:hypothetical protein
MSKFQLSNYLFQLNMLIIILFIDFVCIFDLFLAYIFKEIEYFYIEKYTAVICTSTEIKVC